MGRGVKMRVKQKMYEQALPCSPLIFARFPSPFRRSRRRPIQELSWPIALQEQSCSFDAKPGVRYVVRLGLAKEVPRWQGLGWKGVTRTLREAPWSVA